MDPREARTATITALAAVLGAAALAGLIDVALHGRGLDAPSSAATVGLWIALAAVPGLALAAAARGLPRAPGRASKALRAGGAFALVLAPLLAAALGAARYQPPALPPLAAEPAPVVDSAAEPARPHVVLIVLDTLRADHLGVYGGDPTPAFDGLAARSTLFERCFAQASWTVPSHASLFTGLYPVSHGASFEGARRLDDHFVTLAESLRDAGYRTAAFAANPHLALANLDQGFELYREVAAPFSALTVRRPLAVLGGPARWIDEGALQSVREIDAFLEGHAARRPTAPLFLFVNWLEPHWRHLPPYAERRDALERTGGYFAGTLASVRYYGPLAMARGGLETPNELATLRALYRAEVRYQDRLLGALLQSLERHLDPAHTLLIATADHGENLGEGGRFDHVFALNDHLIRVPMLIRHPDFAAGARRRELCQLVDVPATVSAVVGLAEADRGAGTSLATETPAARRFVYAEGDPYLDHLERMTSAAGPGRDLSELEAPLRSVRDERFKLVASPGRTSALFDLDADPDELHDVSARHPERRALLERELARWRASQPRGPTDGASAPSDETIDAEARARLEALGYGR